jgi:outer membrane lipoprotein-sorting protein
MSMVETEYRASAPTADDVLSFRPASIILWLLIQLAVSQPAGAQQSNASAVDNVASRTAEQIVQNLVRMNIQRAQALHGYQGKRIYRAEYHGLGGARTAEMNVTVKYLSPGQKEFTIHSATGSKLIIDRVFKKLLDAEKDALDAEMQRRSALTEDNYRFTLIGLENGAPNAQYVFEVEPRNIDKFLYRGRIWVDAKDFAVVRLQAEPAKNPSFWTKKAEIVQVYKKVGDFWLPVLNHSVSAIRLGGHAELTIEYLDYDINPSGRESNVRTPQITSGTQRVGAQN